MRGQLLLASFIVLAVEAAKLPQYLTPRCSRSAGEAELSACTQKLANQGISSIANGDRKLRIPSMRPLIVPRMSLSQGTNQIGLNLTWEPAQIWGLGESKMSDMKMSWEKKTTEFTVTIPSFTLGGNYKSSGRVLLLPITGSGPSNFTVRNLKVHYKYDFPLKKGADGKEYCTIVNSSIKIVGADSMDIHFEGLFNGDKLLGDQMNIFLNENWRELIKELGPGLAEATGEVVKLVVLGLANHVPIDEMFGP